MQFEHEKLVRKFLGLDKPLDFDVKVKLPESLIKFVELAEKNLGRNSCSNSFDRKSLCVLVTCYQLNGGDKELDKAQKTAEAEVAKKRAPKAPIKVAAVSVG